MSFSEEAEKNVEVAAVNVEVGKAELKRAEENQVFNFSLLLAVFGVDFHSATLFAIQMLCLSFPFLLF